MYVTKRNDKYRAWERVVLPDGTVKKVSVTMDRDTPQSRNKARLKLQEKITRLAPVDGITFAELVKRYLQDQETRLKPSTMRKNRLYYELFARKMGKRKVTTLTAGELRKVMLEMSDKPSVLNEYRTRLKAIIRWAYENDYINSTACVDKIRAWDVPKRDNSQKYLEREELKAVITASEPFYGSLIEFLALSGLRVGEMIALDSGDVTDEEITVNKTYDPETGMVTTTKTEASTRIVYVQPELLKTIKRIRTMSNTHRVRSGSRSTLFIISVYGERLSYQSFCNYVKLITESVTGRKLTPHALRHTHTSLLAEAGIPLPTISRRLGHHGSKVTTDVYLHVTQKMEEKDRAALRAVSML